MENPEKIGTAFDSDSLMDALGRHVKLVIEDHVKASIERAKKGLDAAVPKICSEIAVSVSRAMEPMITDVVFQVRLSNKLR